MSSSSDDDVLSQLLGVRTQPLRRSNRIKSPEVENFEIDLPAIFRTDAERNFKIKEKGKLLQQSLRDDEVTLQRKYSKVMHKKQQILRELNDNGSGLRKVYTLERDELNVELLVQDWIYDDDDSVFSVPRHFYYFRNVYEIQLPGVFFKNKTRLFYSLNDTRQWDRLFEQVIANVKDFMDSIMGLTSYRELEQLSKFIVEAPQENPKVSLPSISYYFSLIGENIKVEQLPLKIVQFANYNKLNLLRARVIINLYFRFTEQSCIQYFIYILVDYNVNQHNSKDLLEFVQAVLPQLVQSPTFVLEFYEALMSLHTVIKYHESEVRKSEYEFTFNVLRVLNLAVPSKAVDQLNALFMDPTSKDIDHTYILNGIIKSVKHNDLNRTGEMDDPNWQVNSTNQFYRDCFRIYLLPFVLTSLFVDIHKNKESGPTLMRDNIKLIRQRNATRLKKLIALLDDLKGKVHENVRALGFADKSNSPVFNKDDMVKHATDSFHTMTNLYNKFQVDLGMIRDDFFYEE